TQAQRRIRRSCSFLLRLRLGLCRRLHWSLAVHDLLHVDAETAGVLREAVPVPPGGLALDEVVGEVADELLGALAARHGAGRFLRAITATVDHLDEEISELAGGTRWRLGDRGRDFLEDRRRRLVPTFRLELLALPFR